MLPSAKEILAHAKVSAFLITNLTNIRYLTGMEVSAGIVLILPRSSIFFVDGRYIEAAGKGVIKGITIRDASSIGKHLSKVAKCGCESEDVTLARMRKWKREFKNTKFVQKTGIIEHFRRTKSAGELRNFHRAQGITQEVMGRIPKSLKSGVTENGIAWKIEGWMRELGADGIAFDPIVAFGTNSSRPHHHPTDRKLKKGEIVQIDMGARHKGYCADQSQVFFTGKKTVQQEKVLSAVREAKDAAVAAVKVGVTTHELDRIARKILRKHEFEKYFTHALGHGLGLDVHEGVSLSQKVTSKKLMKNEIITIEPGVYIPGKFGIRLEDEVVVR